jgi:hypothetical protein
MKANNQSDTKDKMKKAISQIVDQALGNINESIVKRTATESLARVAMHTKQQNNPPPAVYDTSGYSEPQYTANTSGPSDLTLTPGSGYPNSTDGGNIAMPYNLGNQMPVVQQTSNTFDQPTYIKVDEDNSLNPSHAAALAAAATVNTSQPPNNSYVYTQNLPQVTNSHPSTYAANGYSPQDWRQWTQTYMQQQVGPSGEYLNTATTLMALGGRDGAPQDTGNGQDGQNHVDHTHLGHLHWPGVAFPGAANRAPHHQ